ncbi:MAG: hypothetical protein OH335_04340 [Candidatus Parvarchaeota archaeon]|nr:hypothetical protein [Candidatus Jingweiarchaeum tengchongense]
MNIIQTVGIPTATYTTYDDSAGHAISALQSVIEFGQRALIPVIAGASTHMSSLDEITGVQQFLQFLSNEKLAISSPSDVWKYATFISYIADYRDIAAISNNSKTPLILTDSAFSTETNILQTANYTLTTFSGECGSYHRLYAATQSVLDTKYTYNVFFTPDANAGGHVTDLWSMDGETWHISDYFNEYIGSNPFQLAAWLWATQYQNSALTTNTQVVLNGWSDFSITIVNNNYFAGNYNQTSFLTPISSAHVNELLSQHVIDDTTAPTQTINYISHSTWDSYAQLADKTFDIISYTNNTTTTSQSNTTSTTSITTQTDNSSKYLPYIVGGLALMMLLISES